MGWSGFGIYDGDGTQTCVYSFMKWAGWKDEDAIFDAMGYKKTKLTDEMKKCLTKNIKKVLVKMPKVTRKIGRPYFKDEDDAIEWQMLLALFLDSKLKVPKVIKTNGVLATEYLMEEHASEFNEPNKRRARLRAFIKKAK